MTKKELKQKVLDFLLKLDDTDNDEWYATDRCIHAVTIGNFLNEINIDISEWENLK